ncbi:hypothetical protein NDU88_001619 [Pleurodeles waltl]|uniref:Uncharacterized protein n=1 Tax=Pleurodeles waltl TaxID=8319 RepID=A0AAV7VWX8_PLEWA|nr:hypothetical protein NDU88_001619 [Pleurodeles waltl]
MRSTLRVPRNQRRIEQGEAAYPRTAIIRNKMKREPPKPGVNLHGLCRRNPWWLQIVGSEQGRRDSDEVWRQRRSKARGSVGVVYCRDQALSVSVRRARSVYVCLRERALSVFVYCRGRSLDKGRTVRDSS